MARLVLRHDDDERVIELADPVTVIGRAPESTIMLDVQECSRRQAHIEKCEAGYKLVDLESRNGTRVNGKVANQHLLATGDIIKIGKVTLKFEASAVSTDPPPPAERPPSPPAAVAPHHPAAALPHHPGGIAPVERRTRRARSHALQHRSTTGVAGFIVTAIAVAITIVIMNPGASDGERARSIIEEASKLDPESAIRKLRGIPPEAGPWFDEAQGRIRALERQRDLARGSGLSEEQAWDILREFVARHPSAGHADRVVKDAMEFKAAWPRTGHLAEVDEFIAAARQKKNAAQLADIQKVEAEVGTLTRRSNFGAAVQALNALHARTRSDLALRGTIEKRHRDVVEAGRAWFKARIDRAKEIQANNPDEAQRIFSEIVTNLGDGKVEEFATCCTLAVLLHRLLVP